jgi:hypothetical protein
MHFLRGLICERRQPIVALGGDRPCIRMECWPRRHAEARYHLRDETSQRRSASLGEAALGDKARRLADRLRPHEFTIPGMQPGTSVC